MSIENYADILKLAIQLQINGVKEDIENKPPLTSTEYLEGVRRGLEIALEKIDASAFLWEKGSEEE